MAKRSKAKTKSRIMAIIVAVLVVIVLALIIMLVIGLKNNKDNKESELEAQQTELAGQNDTQEDTNQQAEVQTIKHSSKYEILPDEYGNPIAQIDVDINELKAINPDTCGWIYIPDADINCPIVCNEDDTDYYLTNDIAGFNGVFMQSYNSSDFTDRMSVVYGKNQNSKSQFEGLLKFRDKSFYDAHKYIYIATEDKILTYKIFAARKAYAEHLMIGYDWSVDQVFLDYLIYLLEGDDVDPSANLDSEAEISVNDRVITLSERIDGEPDYRYLVQGVLINESIKETP